MNTEKDLSLLVTRLEKLERQNRFFKILGVMILLAAGAALFMGARPLDVPGLRMGREAGRPQRSGERVYHRHHHQGNRRGGTGAYRLSQAGRRRGHHG